MSPVATRKHASRIDRIQAFEGSTLLPGDRVTVRGKGPGTLSTTYLLENKWQGKTTGYKRRYDVNLDSGEELRGLDWCRVIPVT